ncbi:histidine phosphatase family protein [Pengzhenrongella sp.]|uniref:histidine phosphatase family protein n=1 Tax=Pengzhenrongella sp. TaxID=2888820 RepID=UPI0039C95924
MTASRYLYLTRHGEVVPDESGLSGNGRRQAGFLGRRLRGVPLAAIQHGPSHRTTQTAQLIGAQLDGVPEVTPSISSPGRRRETCRATTGTRGGRRPGRASSTWPSTCARPDAPTRPR